MQKKSLIKNRAATKKALLARKNTKLSGNTKGSKIAGAQIAGSAAMASLATTNKVSSTVNALSSTTASAANTNLSMSQVGFTNSQF